LFKISEAGAQNLGGRALFLWRAHNLFFAFAKGGQGDKLKRAALLPLENAR
jgi:hypothetical protein